MGVKLREDSIQVAGIKLSPVLVAVNTTAEQTFTVPNLKTTDVILGLQKPTSQAGLGIVGQRVSAADTLAVTFSNNTGSNITPTASEVYALTVLRPELHDQLPTGISPGA